MKKPSLVGQVTHAASHPVSSLAYAAGVVRGFAAAVLRVAAGERGPVMPGDLPGPVAAPVEEDVAPDEVEEVPFAEVPFAETPEETDDLPDGVVATLQAHDPVGDPVDHAAMRASLSESDTLRRAAERLPD
ncbi:hypothetical protein [Marmoricola sp. RAF53]|uniref:hypothetical protein n=1 Tax=Marmoricola sp. RAF53 TaxID=3233059 RepID=UPI003F9C6305